MKKETKMLLIIIAVLIIILGILVSITMNEMNQNSQMHSRDGISQEFGNQNEEKTEKETKASDIDEGQEITVSNIDLSQYNSNITITKAGEYTLKGEFKHSVLVNAESDVTLILDDVNIENTITATIVNVGASEYDSCIYSKGKLIIEGSGTLNVYGNQEEGEGIATETNDITINSGTINIECQDDGINAGGDGGLITINDGEIYIKANGDGIDSNKNLIINGGSIYTMGSSVGGDAGIDTDGGFEINGGIVIALGLDMLEIPEKTSKQNSVCFELNAKISNGTKVSLKNELNEEIISFEAKEDFRTLIISNSKLVNGTYYLYENGEKTDYTAQAE